MVSCSDLLTPDRSGDIAIAADVNSLGVEVKSAAVPFEEISKSTPLNARLMCSFTPGVYMNDPQEPWLIPCHTNVTFESGDLTFVKYAKDQNVNLNLTYPTPADASEDENDEITENVYCVGMYPNSGWSVAADGKSATHPINGSDDLMFADQVVGTWDKHFPAQKYAHLQTWVTILVSANTIDAAVQWGKIKEVTIKSADAVTINYPTTANGKSTIDYPGTKQIEVFSSNTGQDLNITTFEIGSVFMVPAVYQKNGLTLSVTVKTTTFPEGKTVEGIKLLNENNVQITDISEIIGKVFVINLNFNPLSIIEGVCTLHYWNDQDEDIYLQ